MTDNERYIEAQNLFVDEQIERANELRSCIRHLKKILDLNGKQFSLMIKTLHENMLFFQEWCKKEGIDCDEKLTDERLSRMMELYTEENG